MLFRVNFYNKKRQLIKLKKLNNNKIHFSSVFLIKVLVQNKTILYYIVYT